MAGRLNSLALVVVKADPPGKKICSYIRGIASDHSKTFVAGLPGSLAPGNLQLLIRLQMPDMTNIEVIEGEKSLADAIKALESKGKYRKGQALEVFCAPEHAKSIGDDIRSGKLKYDPTTISIVPQSPPVDDMDAIIRAVEGQNQGQLRMLLDPRIFSNRDGIEAYANALFSPKHTVDVGVNVVGSSRRIESRKLQEGSLPSPVRWPEPDAFVGIEGQGEIDRYGSKILRYAKVPVEVVVPAGTVLYHGTSADDEFDMVRGPASFSLDRKTAQLYADHEHGGPRPRVMEFVLSKDLRCVDHPGVHSERERAEYWLQRWATDVLGMKLKDTRDWGMVGIGRAPEFLKVLESQGYDGLVIRKLDDGGTEVCVFDPQNSVRGRQAETLIRESVDMSWMQEAHEILDVVLDARASDQDWKQPFKEFMKVVNDGLGPWAPIDRAPEALKSFMWKTPPGAEHLNRTSLHTSFDRMIRNEYIDRVANYQQGGHLAWSTGGWDWLKTQIDWLEPDELQESLVREFLTDIAPTRELGIRTLHDLLSAEVDTGELEYLGSGRNGSAYRTPDGLVLKITTDPLEAKSASALVGKACEYLYLVHSVRQLSERVWLIEQEGDLEDLPSEYSEELDLAVEIIEVVGGSMALRDGDWPGVIECLANSTDPGVIPEVLEVAEKFGIEGMCEEVREHGLCMDLHSGNVKLRSGCPVLLDLGTPGDPIDVRESRDEFKVVKGMPLYHTTNVRFDSFKNRPTWFTPTASEALGYSTKHGSIVLLCEYVGSKKIASTEEVIQFVSEIWGEDPDTLVDDPLYSRFDISVGEFEVAKIKQLIKTMVDRGYGGAIHPDYSGIDDQEDAYTLVIFSPATDVKILREISRDELISMHEAAGMMNAPMGGSVNLRGAGSSAWSGGSMVLAKPDNHVPEDDDEEGIDWSFYGQGVGSRLP